jgi:hypothetical protein
MKIMGCYLDRINSFPVVLQCTSKKSLHEFTYLNSAEKICKGYFDAQCFTMPRWEGSFVHVSESVFHLSILEVASLNYVALVATGVDSRSRPIYTRPTLICIALNDFHLLLVEERKSTKNSSIHLG